MTQYDVYRLELRLFLYRGLSLRSARIAALAVARETLPF